MKGEIPSRVSISKLGWDLVLAPLVILVVLASLSLFVLSLIPTIYPTLPLVIPLDSISILLEILLIVFIKTLIDD